LRIKNATVASCWTYFTTAGLSLEFEGQYYDKIFIAMEGLCLRENSEVNVGEGCVRGI